MRMQANKHSDVHDFHDVEHDYMEGCDDRPKCLPVSPLDRATLKKLREAVIARTGASSQEGEPEPTFAVYDDPPSHYDGGDIQPWDVIDAFGLDYYLGNILKYTCRAGKKDGESRLKDLKKIRNFINRAIELEEKES